MKILVTSLPDLKKINPQRPHHLLKYLSQKHEVTVLCVNAWWLEERSDRYLEECIKHLKLIYLTERKINPVLQELSILNKFDDLDRILDFDSFDVHINLNSLIAGYYITKKLKSYGVPTVFDVADDLPEIIRTSPQIPRSLRPMGKLCGRYLLGKNIKQSDRITLITSGLMQSYGFPPDKTMILPNGIDTFLFNHEKPLSESSENKEEFILGFIGALTDWVEFDPLFRAIKNLSLKNYPIRLIIIGHGEKFQNFINHAQKLNISDCVTFMGWVTTEELPRLIARMDVCFICRKTTQDSQNSFPLKLLEYMACGKSVISVRLRGVMEAVQDRVLYASDSKEIEQRIIELYKDREMRERLGTEGMSFVRENYSWEAICDDFERVLYGAKNERN